MNLCYSHIIGFPYACLIHTSTCTCTYYVHVWKPTIKSTAMFVLVFSPGTRTLWGCGHALPEIYVHRALSCVPCGTSVCCTSWSSLCSTMSLSRQRMTFLVVAGRSHAWMGSVIGLWLHHRAIDISYIVAPSGWTKRAALHSPSSPGQGWVGEMGGAVGEVETSWY